MTKQQRTGWCFLISASIVTAAPLQQETLNAWENYLRMVEARTRVRLEPSHSFLWIDGNPERRRQIRNGSIIVAPSREQAIHLVPGGLVHDWIAGMFIPGASIGDVLAVVHRYDRYNEIFKPTVVASRELTRSPNSQSFTMLWVRKVMFLTGGVEGYFESRDFPVSDSRWYGLSYSTQLREIESYGKASEQKFPADQGPGYLWRVYSVTRYEQRDGGVYLEMEALALTRDIPPSMRWIVRPIIEKLSKSTMMTSLEQTRAAVRAFKESSACKASLSSEKPDEHLPTR